MYIPNREIREDNEEGCRTLIRKIAKMTNTQIVAIARNKLVHWHHLLKYTSPMPLCSNTTSGRCLAKEDIMLLRFHWGLAGCEKLDCHIVVQLNFAAETIDQSRARSLCLIDLSTCYRGVILKQVLIT